MRFLEVAEGKCWLCEPRVADAVQEALFHWDVSVSELHEPNHVHLLNRFADGAVLGDVIGR